MNRLVYFVILNKKLICIIPARGGSKEVPKKNIRFLGDKPLIAHTIESAINSDLFDHVIVSTEDDEIAEISKKYGAEVPFMRPKELATDSTSTDEVINFCIPKLHSLGYEFEIFVLRDCTVPFIDDKDMLGAIQLLKQKNCDAVFGAIKAHPSPYFGMMELDKNGFLKPSKPLPREIFRRQDGPTVWIVDGLFVFFTKKFLKNQFIYRGNILPYEISKLHAHMIDYELDFEIGEFLYKNTLKK